MRAEIDSIFLGSHEGDGHLTLTQAKQVSDVARMVAIMISEGDLMLYINSATAQLFKESFGTRDSCKGNHRTADCRQFETAGRLPKMFGFECKSVERRTIHCDYSIGPSQRGQFFPQSSSRNKRVADVFLGEQDDVEVVEQVDSLFAAGLNMPFRPAASVVTQGADHHWTLQVTRDQ